MITVAVSKNVFFTKKSLVIIKEKAQLKGIWNFLTIFCFDLVVMYK